jgi:hypothetical protein
MAVFWDRDRQERSVASSLDRTQGPERFEEMHRIIDSIPCSTIRSRWTYDIPHHNIPEASQSHLGDASRWYASMPSPNC